jgi:hypothetical protein
MTRPIKTEDTLAITYYSRHTQDCKEKHKVRRDKIRDLIHERLGKKCKRCGFADKRALQIDHIFGGGSKELREIGNTYTYYLRLSVLPNLLERYQLLCANCNWIKKSEDVKTN